MDDIIEPTMDYDFEKLYFGPPTTLAGGAYFSRLMYNTNKTLFNNQLICNELDSGMLY